MKYKYKYRISLLESYMIPKSLKLLFNFKKSFVYIFIKYFISKINSIFILDIHHFHFTINISFINIHYSYNIIINSKSNNI